MANKRYFWLKLQENFFRDKPIKKLRKLAGGDTFTIIYLKMMLISLKTNGKIFFDGVEDTFADEIALEIGEDADNVRFTIMYLISKGLLQEVNETEIIMTQLPELVGSETESAARMRKKRHRDLLASEQNIQLLSQCDEDVTETRHNVQACDTEIDIDIEKEKEKEIEIERRDKKINYQEIVNLYNETCVSFPVVRSLSDARKKAIKARLKKYTVEDFKLCFEKAESSEFLKGGNKGDWSANFDWMIKDSNMAKILDGNYDSYAKKGQRQQSNGWNQGDVDLDGII